MGSFQLKTVESFIGEDLPRLVQGREQMTALFVTYNAVDGYDNGPVVHGKRGLTVRVHSGDLGYTDVTIIAVIASAFNPTDPDILKLGELGSRRMDQEGAAAQERAEQALMGQPIPIDDENVLAVVYAGLSAFGKVVAFARSLRAQHPHATLVILTCDCDLESKLFELKLLVEQGIVDYALATPECGGREPMRELLEAVVAAWPKI